jgi:hypothetical protein
MKPGCKSPGSGGNRFPYGLGDGLDHTEKNQFVKRVESIPIKDTDEPLREKAGKNSKFCLTVPDGIQLKFQKCFPGGFHFRYQHQAPGRGNFQYPPEIKGIPHMKDAGMPSTPLQAYTPQEPVQHPP